jgi:hypothetical protein
VQPRSRLYQSAYLSNPGNQPFPFGIVAQRRLLARELANVQQALHDRGCVKTWVNFELGGRATPPHHERIAYSAI